MSYYQGAQRQPPSNVMAQPSRDPMQIIQALGTLLVGIAAIAALVFTWQSVHATNGQLQIAEQGQITDRYNAAITNLGSPSMDVRLGGIYALQRIMQDSPRDQPTVVAVLCAFVRDHSAAGKGSPAGRPADVQAALIVVLSRNTANDGRQTLVDLRDTDLSLAPVLAGLNMSGADLSHVYLFQANLVGTNLAHADLSGACLADANLTDANLTGANLTGANLTGAEGLPTGTGQTFSGGIPASSLKCPLYRAARATLVRRGFLHDPCQVVRVAVGDGPRRDAGNFVGVLLLGQGDDFGHAVAPRVQGRAAFGALVDVALP